MKQAISTQKFGSHFESIFQQESLLSPIKKSELFNVHFSIKIGQII